MQCRCVCQWQEIWKTALIDTKKIVATDWAVDLINVLDTVGHQYHIFCPGMRNTWPDLLTNRLTEHNETLSLHSRRGKCPWGTSFHASYCAIPRESSSSKTVGDTSSQTVQQPPLICPWSMIRSDRAEFVATTGTRERTMRRATAGMDDQ